MLVLLDRDGVLNMDLAESVTTPEQFRMINGAAEAVAKLCAAGFKIAVVTNQSVVGDNRMSQETLDQIHVKMTEEIKQAGGEIHRIYVCTDSKTRPSLRRKPNPGMLLEALKYFRVEASKTPMVGDDLRDLEAAYAAGCPRILVKTGKGEKNLVDGLPDRLQPIRVCENLGDAVEHIVKTYGRKNA